MAFITQAQRTKLIELYVGYFNRAPEQAGLSYWANDLLTRLGQGKTEAQAFKEIADEFYKAGEQFGIFSAADPVDVFITKIYQNVLGRNQVDQAGMDYWKGKLNSGEVSRGQFVNQLIQEAKAYVAAAPANDPYKWVGTYLENRVAVADWFANNSANLTGQAAIQQGTAIIANSVTPTSAQNGQTAQQAVAAAQQASQSIAGQTFMLTTGVDNITGTSGNDTINAVIDATNSPAASTFTALDSIDGGAGTDTLKISAVTDVAAPAGATVTNVENVTLQAAAKIGTFNANGTGALDLSTLFGGVSNLTVTSGSEADFKAATGTAVNLSGVTGGVEIVGGASQTVSLAAQGGNVKLSGTTGAVSFTSAKHGSNTVTIDGGSTVTVSTTSTVNNGNITIGGTTPATGAVSVTSALNGDGTSGLDQGDITVTGGSTVTVNSSLTITAKDQNASSSHTFGDVKVTGDGKTTSVTVNQTYAETEFTKAAVAAVKETSVVTFSAMTAGQTLSINGLTFTASKNLTAAEVASAFSNLTAADRQSAQGPVANGVFTGDFNTAVWTSGAASGAVVTFTAQDDDETDLSFTGTATAPTQVKTAGTAGSAAATSNNTVTYGAVRVDDVSAASITTVNVNGYGSADLGKTGTDLNALTTLSLANSGGAADVATSATTLGLTVNNVQHVVNLDHTAATIKTLNVTATGKDSTFGLTAAAVEDLTVTGDKVLDIDTGSTLTALKTVTVTGSAGLSINATGLANQTSFNTTGTTGTVTATIDASKATYTGGAGVDNVTLSSTTVSKAISTGAGNDKVTLASGTTALAAAINAGDGTDTLAMASADAATASGSNVFETFIDGFEKLSLGQVATTANNSIDLSNMDDISYVISAGTADAAEVKTLTLTVGTAIAAGDTVSITINGTTYTTAALSASASAADIAAAIDTAVGTAYNVTASSNVLTFTSATGGTTILSGLTVTGSGTVTGAEAETSSQLTLTKMANNGTLELTGAGVGATVTMTDATGTADSFNIVTKVDSTDLNFGIVSVAGVETINLTATDISTSAISKATLALADSAAKTVSVTGESDLALDLSLAQAVTAVNAGSFTGKLTLTATGSAAMTVTGGSGADTLTASGSGDTLLGGAGNDVLTGADLTTLTGGAGNDIFMMNKPSNVNTYSTITDLAAGDVIDLDASNSGTVVFTKSAIVLAGTAVFQDYANAAINALGADGNDAAWFQYGGNTYIVQSGNSTAGNDFVNGSDSIIKITGLVDLSTASYNQTYGTLEIA